MALKKIKNLFKSKTFWLAATQGVLGVLVVVSTEVPELGWIAVAKSILDVALRLATGEPVQFKLK